MIRHSPEVWCDGVEDDPVGGCGGGYWTKGGRKQARAEGWSRLKGRDYCECCTEAIRQSLAGDPDAQPSKVKPPKVVAKAKPTIDEGCVDVFALLDQAGKATPATDGWYVVDVVTVVTDADKGGKTP